MLFSEAFAEHVCSLAVIGQNLHRHARSNERVISILAAPSATNWRSDSGLSDNSPAQLRPQLGRLVIDIPHSLLRCLLWNRQPREYQIFLDVPLHMPITEQNVRPAVVDVRRGLARSRTNLP